MYIGIDLGTTACKAARLDARGAVVAKFHKEYGLITRDGFVEQDAEIWWQLVLEALKTVGAPTVQGISISTQGVALVATDGQGKPLGNAISWLDTRAKEEAKALEDAVGGEYIRAVTGKTCGGSYVLPKLMWLKRRGLYENARYFLLPLAYLNLRLTGRAVTDYTVAGGTMAYDMTNKRYDPTLLQAAGISESVLAEVACMGSPVGRLLPEVARQTGLPECTLYLGGQDQKLAALGAGIDENTVTVSLGTASAVSRLTRQLPTELPCSAFRFDEDHYSLEGVLDTSGGALKWLMGILGQPDYEAMNRLAEEAGDSGGLVFCTDLTAGGSVENLRLGTTKGHLVYALMEGVSRAIGALAENMGGCEKLVVFGGGARSPVWCRILAKTTGKTVCVPETEETGILGAARLASQMKLPHAKVKKAYAPET